MASLGDRETDPLVPNRFAKVSPANEERRLWPGGDEVEVLLSSAIVSVSAVYVGLRCVYSCVLNWNGTEASGSSTGSARSSCFGSPLFCPSRCYGSDVERCRVVCFGDASTPSDTLKMLKIFRDSQDGDVRIDSRIVLQLLLMPNGRIRGM